MALERRDHAPSVRVSDADRDAIVAQLRTHLADGRLSIDEFSDRVSEALSARTAADLASCLRELPVEEPSHVVVADDLAGRAKRRQKLRRDAAGFVTTNATCIGIWALSGGRGYFWPAWVLFGTGVGFLGRLISGESKEDKREREQREKQESSTDASVPSRIVATVLFVDIVGPHDDLDRFGLIVRSELARFGGREVFLKGDEVCADFETPAQAIRCACAIRDSAAAIGMHVRAGLHAGEVERRNQDVSGIALHIAHRVSTAAGTDEVLVSSTVKDLAAGSGISFADRGERELKGGPEARRLFAVERC